MLKNPAEDIARRRVVPATILIPTREQFRNLIAAIRESEGREDSKRKAAPGADLVELLAYSGCRPCSTPFFAIWWADSCREFNAHFIRQTPARSLCADAIRHAVQ